MTTNVLNINVKELKEQKLLDLTNEIYKEVDNMTLNNVKIVTITLYKFEYNIYNTHEFRSELLEKLQYMLADCAKISNKIITLDTLSFDITFINK
jgi:hypothetical protein